MYLKFLTRKCVAISLAVIFTIFNNSDALASGDEVEIEMPNHFDELAPNNSVPRSEIIVDTESTCCSKKTKKRLLGGFVGLLITAGISYCGDEATNIQNRRVESARALNDSVAENRGTSFDDWAEENSGTVNVRDRNQNLTTITTPNGGMWFLVKDDFKPNELKSVVDYISSDSSDDSDDDQIVDSNSASSEITADSYALISSAFAPAPTEFKSALNPATKSRKILRIIGVDNTQYIKFPYKHQDIHQITRHALLTGKIVNGLGGFCSGILVGKTLMLTNAHCFFRNGKINPEQLSGAQAYFEVFENTYQRKASIKSVWIKNYQGYDFASDEITHDYAILVLDQPMGNVYGWAGIKPVNVEDFENYSDQLDKGGVFGQEEKMLSFVGFSNFEEFSCASTPCFQIAASGDCVLQGWAKLKSGWNVKHTCDIAKGASGGAFIEHGPQGANVVALNSAESKVLEENYAVPASIFIQDFKYVKDIVEGTSGFGLTGSPDLIPKLN